MSGTFAALPDLKPPTGSQVLYGSDPLGCKCGALRRGTNRSASRLTPIAAKNFCLTLLVT